MSSRQASLLLSLLLLAACGEPTTDDAKRRLAEKNVPVSEQALLAKTKEAAAGADAAKLLVQAGVDPNARQANGMTALMSAAFNGQREVAEALIKRGADVNATAAGFTALRLAVERGDKAMVRLLLDHGAKPNLKPDGAPSALEKAQQGNDREILERLQKAGGS
jgi:ankyrin repeat protein